MLIILAAAPLVLPALGAAVASLNTPDGLAGAVESYSHSRYQKDESLVIARIPCNGCRAYAGPSDERGSEYVPFSSLETDLVFGIRIPQAEPSRLLVNDVNIIPLGPNLALAAYQLPRFLETEKSIFSSDESEWKKLPLGYDLMVHASRESEESTQRTVTVNIRVTSVAGERNDAIEELEVVVTEDLEADKLEIKSVTVKPLPGAPLVWLDEPGTPSDFGSLEPVDVDIEIEMKGVPCGTNLGCILEAVRENLRKMRDAAFGGIHKDTVPHPCPHHQRPEYEDSGLDEDLMTILPIEDDLNLENFPVVIDDMPQYSYPDFEELHDPSLFQTVSQIMAPIFVGISAGIAVSLLGLVLGQLLMMGWRRIQSSKKHRCPRSRKCRYLAEARAMLTVPEDDELPAYRDDDRVDVVEKE